MLDERIACPVPRVQTRCVRQWLHLLLLLALLLVLLLLLLACHGRRIDEVVRARWDLAQLRWRVEVAAHDEA